MRAAATVGAAARPSSAARRDRPDISLAQRAPLPALFIDLTGCPADSAPGQVVSADQLAGSYAMDCGADGIVSATWDLRACVAGQECPLAAECRLGLTECDAPVQSCVDSGPAPDGTPCTPSGGGPGACSGGGCI